MVPKRVLFLSGVAAPAAAQTFLYQKAYINDPTCSIEANVAYGNAFPLDVCLKALVAPTDPNSGTAFFKTSQTTVEGGDGEQAETTQFSGEGCTGTETTFAVYAKATDGNVCDGAFTGNGASGNYLLEFPSARRSVRQATAGVDVKIYPGAGCTEGSGETTSNLFAQATTCTDTTFERNGAASHYITGYVNPDNVVVFQSFSDSACGTSRHPYVNYAPMDTCLVNRNGVGSVMFVAAAPATTTASSVIVPPTVLPTTANVTDSIIIPTATATTAANTSTTPTIALTTEVSSPVTSGDVSSTTITTPTGASSSIGSFTDTTTPVDSTTTAVSPTPTVDPTPAPEPNTSSSPNLGLIIGASCGGVLALVLGAGLIFWCTRKRSAAPKDTLPRDELNAVDTLPPAIIAVNKAKGTSKNSWPVPTNGQPKPQPWTAWSDILLVEKVGAGTFGTVSKGHLRQDGRAHVVAVRVLEKDDMTSSDNFVTIAEAEGQLKLSHPNLVSIYSVSYDTEDPRAPVATILEWMEGGSLASHVRTRAAEGNPLRPEDRLYILTEAAKGLAYLSAMRVTHQGVSAKNVLLASPVASAAGDSGKLIVKVSDYGIWRPTRYSQMVKTDEGTVRWMAPESLHPSRPAFSEQSDVYSFGILIWELFNDCSTIPWAEKSNGDAASAIRRGQRLPTPQRCPIPMIRLLNKCTEFDARQRGTFQNVLDDLAAMAGTSWIPSRASFDESRTSGVSQTPSNM